jgi:hypothetical protein
LFGVDSLVLNSRDTKKLHLSFEDLDPGGNFDVPGRRRRGLGVVVLDLE